VKLLASVVATFALGAGSVGVQAHTSHYGRVLFDQRGFVLYGFTADSARASRCYGACARAWPPLLVKTAAKALRGVDRTKLGTVTRRNGTRQVTYGGHPLYYYAADTSPGQMNGQASDQFGAEWYVVGPAGSKVEKGEGDEG
jgi:predicted lipoprotein with Yx(FWY)xxD motif